MNQVAKRWPAAPAVRGLAGCLLLGVALSGCAMFTKTAAETACDGRPNWCLTVANEVANETGVYVDGQTVATAPAQGSVKVPLAAGESHQVNYCRNVRVNKELFGLIGDTKVLCSKPAAVALDGNQTKIVYDSSNLY